MIVTFSRPLLTLGTLRLSVVGSLCKVLAELGVEATFPGSPPSFTFTTPKSFLYFKGNLNDEKNFEVFSSQEKKIESIQDGGAFKKIFLKIICR